MPGEGLEVLERRARAHPELAVAGVGEELLGVPAGERADVQHGVVAAAVVAGAVLDGVQDEHRVRLLLGPQAGEVRERGVRAEAVVGVVGARLERAGGDDEPLAGELRRQRRTSRGGVVGGRAALEGRRRVARPSRT